MCTIIHLSCLVFELPSSVSACPHHAQHPSVVKLFLFVHISRALFTFSPRYHVYMYWSRALQPCTALLVVFCQGNPSRVQEDGSEKSHSNTDCTCYRGGTQIEELRHGEGTYRSHDHAFFGQVLEHVTVRTFQLLSWGSSKILTNISASGREHLIHRGDLVVTVHFDDMVPLARYILLVKS